MTATVTLKAGREASLARRHPWVFSGAIGAVAGAPAAGDVVAVRRADGAFAAWAAYSPASQIRLRVFAFDEAATVDAGLVAARLRRALERRRRLGLDGPDAACRLVFAESDGLPGLVVDRYGEFIVCQFLAAAAEPWREVVVDTLTDLLAPAGILERSSGAARRREGLESRQGLLAGRAPDGPVGFARDARRGLADLEHGQKTGAFLDQLDNHGRVAACAAGGRVLDAFAYTGGFGIAALAAGAEAAVLVDSSAPALALAAGAAAANGVAARCRTVEADVRTELAARAAAGERFELVVVDPPKFIHNAGQLRRGARAYQDLNRAAIGLVAPGGALATFSCSGNLDRALFQKIVADAALEAGRDAAIVARLAQPGDHPVALTLPEADYLKGLVLRVD